MQSDVNNAATPQRPRWNPTIKIVVGVVLFVLVAAALLRFSVVFVPLIIGAIIAYIFQPVVELLNERLRLPRGLAAALIYLVALAIIIPVVYSLSPVIKRQIEFLGDELLNFIAYVDTLSPDTTVTVLGIDFGVQDLIDQITAELANFITSVVPGSITVVFNIAEILLMVIFTLLIGFYLTKDAPKFVTWIKGLVPPGHDEDAEKLLTEIDNVWSSFFRGQLTLALTVAIIITTTSSIIGLPQPVLMGVLAGLLEFLPSVGHAIWIIIALILALLEGSSTLPVSNVVFALIVSGVHLGFTQFDLNYLIPRIIGREVHLHPMVVIIGIIVGASVGGVLGVALAAPVIASLRIVGRYVYSMLFDLDPFPMVGPPSAPRKVRLTHAKLKAAEAPPPPPSPTEVIRQLRQRRSGDGGYQPEPDQETSQEMTES
jgi:predicted PurR-regulated permease PerM